MTMPNYQKSTTNGIKNGGNLQKRNEKVFKFNTMSTTVKKIYQTVGKIAARLQFRNNHQRAIAQPSFQY